MTREQKIEEAKRLKATGLTYEAIGHQLGVTGGAVSYWLNPDRAERNRNAAKARAKNPEYARQLAERRKQQHLLSALSRYPNLPHEQKRARAAEWRAQGYTYVAIGKALGVTGSAVSYWLNPDRAERNRASMKRKNACPDYRKQQRKKAHQFVSAITRMPETYATYFITYPKGQYVNIGKTVKLNVRLKSYNKSLVPQYLMGTSRIPEYEIHELFRHLQAGPEFSDEIFRLTPELRRFIRDNCEPGPGVLFTGDGKQSILCNNYTRGLLNLPARVAKRRAALRAKQ